MVMSFSNFLTEEQAPKKNQHLEHIEDILLDGGIAGTREAIYFLTSLRDMLSGQSSKTKTTLTSKWDGAPAIICGIDPESKKFFVATKSAFSSKPKLNFTDKDIDENHPNEGLNVKMKYALRYLKELEFRPARILQGDLLYTAPDLQTKTIDGESYITFQPNTIVYAVPENSALAKTIRQSKLGIIFHTEYKGKDIASLSAQFNPNISGLKPSRNVWFRDAQFTDVSGTANFTESETKEITEILGEAGRLFQKLSPELLNKIATMSEYSILVKTFNNSKVRQGQAITDTSKHTVEFLSWLDNKLNAKINEVKKPEARKNRELEKAKIMNFFKANRNQLKAIYDMQNILVKAKTMIIQKLNSVRDIGTFLRTDDGFKVTNPEGFVAINHEGNAVKLVDRLTFSHANFTAAKNWTK